MSANSIIQFYLNTANSTANSSRIDITKSPQDLASPPNSLLKKSVNNPVLYKKIEQLPTPITESEKTVSPGFSTDQQSTTKAGSGVPSFFSIPLRFFSSKKSTAKEKEEGHESDQEIVDIQNDLPIDVITDSPLENLLTGGATGTSQPQIQVNSSIEGTNSQLIKTGEDSPAKQSELLSSDYDPIYDTYITYLNYSTPEGDLLLDDRTDERENRGSKFTEEFKPIEETNVDQAKLESNKDCELKTDVLKTLLFKLTFTFLDLKTNQKLAQDDEGE